MIHRMPINYNLLSLFTVLFVDKSREKYIEKSPKKLFSSVPLNRENQKEKTLNSSSSRRHPSKTWTSPPWCAPTWRSLTFDWFICFFLFFILKKKPISVWVLIHFNPFLQRFLLLFAPMKLCRFYGQVDS